MMSTRVAGSHKTRALKGESKRGSACVFSLLCKTCAGHTPRNGRVSVEDASTTCRITENLDIGKQRESQFM